VSLTHAPSSVDGEEEDASVAAAAAAAAASTAAGVGGSEELARWTLTTTEEVKEGTVLVSIPNILTLSPVRRKYKLPSGVAGMQVGREGGREGGGVAPWHLASVCNMVPHLPSLPPSLSRPPPLAQLKDLLSHKASSSSSSSDDGAAAAAISALVGDSAVSELLEKAVIDERIQRVHSLPSSYPSSSLPLLEI